MKSEVLPDNILRCMSPEDRASHAKAVGHPNAGKTAEEIRQDAMKKDERTAQKEIAEYLRMRGLQFINPPMNRKSSLPEGWPDFTLAFRGNALAFEVKVWGAKPRPEQVNRHDKMRDDGWLVYVVNGVADVVAILQLLEAKGRNGLLCTEQFT